MEPMQAFQLFSLSLFFFLIEEILSASVSFAFLFSANHREKRAGEGWLKPINRGSRGATEQLVVVSQGQAGAWTLLQIKPSMTSYVCWGRALLQQGMGAVQGKPLPFLPVLFVWNGHPSPHVSPGSDYRCVQGAPCLARASCFPAPPGTAYPAK